MIVVDIRGMSAGLIVDSVCEVLTIPKQDIVEPPKINKRFGNQFVSNIGKVGNEVKLLLNCEKFLTDRDMETLNEVM